LPATPAEHARLLHPLKAQGQVTVARKLPEPAKWEEQNWESWELEAVLAGAEGQTDTYLSQNRFHSTRRAIAQILELCALYSDVDYYNVPELRGLSPEAVLEKALERLREAGIPEPSLALSSGQGLCLVLQHAPVARKHQPEWNACQDRIYRVLKPLGADSRAREAARVLRIAGTMNSKNGATVRSLGDVGEEVYRFDELAEALVKNPAGEDEEERGAPGADLYSIAVQRAARSLRNHPQGWSEVSLWEGRLTDLQHLRRMRYGEGPMEDFRDRWLFLATTAISWLVVPEVLDREALALAEEAGGWDERRTRSDLSQVLKRARRAARGETIEFEGRAWDPRHHFHNETIIEWLEITREEEREMVVIISPEEETRRKRLRGRKYQEHRRRSVGAATRAQYDKARASALSKKITVVRHLENCGVSRKKIAARMRVSTRTVQRWLS
jgi:Homeodomain-like domain